MAQKASMFSRNKWAVEIQPPFSIKAYKLWSPSNETTDECKCIALYGIILCVILRGVNFFLLKSQSASYPWPVTPPHSPRIGKLNLGLVNAAQGAGQWEHQLRTLFRRRGTSRPVAPNVVKFLHALDITSFIFISPTPPLINVASN